VLGQQTSARAAADQMQFASEAEKYEEAITALDGVVDSYGGTEAGKVARLYRAHALFNLGRYAEAREAYEAFRSDAGHGYLSGLALLNVAHCRTLEGDLPAAIAACQELVDSASQLTFPLDAALSALADVHLKNNDEQAAATLYRRIVSEFPDSAYRFVAEEKLAGLGEEPVAGTAPAME
jgi:predicted negative regulator of RcsB-dependent stress response